MERLYLFVLLLLLVSLIVSNHAIGANHGAYCPNKSPPMFRSYKKIPDHSALEARGDSNSGSEVGPVTGGDSTGKSVGTDGMQCECECECPLVEQRDYEDFKANLAPTIRQRLKELSRKTPTIESAIETAHSIGLLKVFKESNSKLDKIRDDLHQRAQELKKLFEEVDQHID